MSGANAPTTKAGPFRVGLSDVFIHTGSADYEHAARWAFADLATPVDAPPAERVVVFDVDPNAAPQSSWAIRRDGEPCELDLMEEAVLVHQQWELNRLAIEAEPAAIHSAAVSKGGRATLLLGGTHSGKTTLAGWLAIHHDAAYLTDEVAAIDDHGRIVAFPRPLGVRSDSPLADLVPMQDAIGAARFLPHERLVPASSFGVQVSAAPTAIGLLVFPSYSPTTELSVERLDQADAFERVAALTPGLAGHGRVVFERLCRMVGSAPAMAVTYSDVRDVAPAVAEAMDREHER